MKIPFFHDRDYQGYFGILDSSGRNAIYVSDSDVDDFEGAISAAMETCGTVVRINHMTPYQRKRISAILS